eukprot:s2865_g2.t1
MTELAECKVDPENVNIFCNSKLWIRQLVTGQPKAISESEFVVPGGMSCAEGRRNYTDVQETSGTDRPAVVVNGSLYDGCLEKACLKLGCATVSHTDRQIAFQTALGLTKNHLLELWRCKEGVMGDRLPKYKPQLDEDTVPTGPEAPTLKICTMDDETLNLPRAVRSEWLADPVRSPEWKKLLVEFDRTFASPTASDGSSEPVPVDTEPVVNAQPFDWAALFPDEPRDAAAFHAKYRNSGVFQSAAWCPEVCLYVVDTSTETEAHKPKLFVEGKNDYLLPSTEPILTYGAGQWLMDSKAETWLNDQDVDTHKGVMCEFGSDLVKVWRLRAYRNERTLGAAKPLWFMKHELNLGKGDDILMQMLEENHDDDDEMMAFLMSSPVDAAAAEPDAVEKPPQQEPAENPPELDEKTSKEINEEVPQEERAENPPGPAEPADNPPGPAEPADNPPGPARPGRRVRYADMTPESKAKEKKRRIDQHRANSDRWHAKWVSKGVPKNKNSGCGGSAGNAEAAGIAEPERQPPNDDEQPPNDDFRPEIGEELMKEAGFLLEQNHDLILHPFSNCVCSINVLHTHCIQAIGGDMRRVRVSYMQQWMQHKKGHSATHQDANKAWLESELRAQILAGRKGQQSS